MDNSMNKARALPAVGKGVTPSGKEALMEVARQLIAWIRFEHRIHSGITAMSGLDDDSLADIGVPRGYIAHAARYGRPDDD